MPIKNNPHPRGGITLITLLIVAVFGLGVMLTLSLLSISESRMTSAVAASEKTFYAAESGINEALYRLIANPVPQPFSLTLDSVDINVTVGPNPDNPYQRIITSTATDESGKVRTVRIIANTSSFAGGFDYAVQSGEGGLEILNQCEVTGDVYANGNIMGGTGEAIQVTVHGNVWVAHGDPLVSGPGNTDTAAPDFSVADDGTRIDVAQSFIAPASTPLKKIRLYMKRVGTLPDDPALKIVRDDGAGSPSTTSIAPVQVIKKNDIGTSFAWQEISYDIGPLLESGVKYWIVIDSDGANATKHLVFKKSANTAYADGEAKTSPDALAGGWTASDGDLVFETLLGYGDTFIRKVEVDGDVHANTILKSNILNNAYYQTLSEDSTVTGSEFPGSLDPDPKPFPIQDVHINSWKAEAEAGGITAGDVTISGNQSLGPRKIEGNLFIDDGSHLTLTGIVWVTGNINFTKPNGSLSLHPSFGATSSVMIADGLIDIDNNTTVTGSGNAASYIVILSTNNSINPDDPAINASNNSESVLYYAKNGMVRVYNADLNGTSGYFVRLDERCSITYNPALAAFTIPAGGGQTIGTALGTWEEQ